MQDACTEEEVIISKSSNVRKLKVRDRYVVYKDEYYRTTSESHVPQIELFGKWLERFGFTCESFVSVICEEGKLTIVPAEPDPPDPKEVECLKTLEGLSKSDLNLLERSLTTLKEKRRSN